MCGRFTLQTTPEVLAKAFDLKELPEIEPRYNIAPGQLIAAIRHIGEHNKLDFIPWGISPHRPQDISQTPVNARCEAVHENPILVHALKYTRCIIPASGFYEWLPNDNHRQPYYLRLLNSSVIGFAGLYEKWRAEDGTEHECCFMLTTAANELMKPIHDRMPVILQPDDYNLWLNKQIDDPHELDRLYQAYPSELMVAHPVPGLVNFSE